MDNIKEKVNLQISIETMLRCSGSCSGCALTNIERDKADSFHLDDLKNKMIFLYNWLNESNNNIKKENKELEAITVFLGQGDHFFLEDNMIDLFVQVVNDGLPEHLKEKTVIFITASAIGKFDNIKRKSDLFFNASLKYNIPFFIQVVFDPKKYVETNKFKDIYMDNILYFKNKFGMTELSMNLGDDVFTTMSALDFHNWIKAYDFKHVELNWVMNSLTYKMWENSYEPMWDWLLKWIELGWKEKTYEINFIPFLVRYFKVIEHELFDFEKEFEKEYLRNLYVNYNGDVLSAQMGLIGNLTTNKDRTATLNNIPLKKYEPNIHISNFNLTDWKLLGIKEMKNHMKKFKLSKPCATCEYNNFCSMKGVINWLNKNHFQSNACYWKIDVFLTKFKEIIHKYQPNYAGETIFDKNPVQTEKIMQKNNAFKDYFESKLLGEKNE